MGGGAERRCPLDRVFPHRWMQPAWSLPPGGSRTKVLAVSPSQYDFRPFLHRLTHAQLGFSFRRGPLFLPQALFPQRAASSFKDWARAVLHPTVLLLLGSRNPPHFLAVSAFSPSPEQKHPKISSRRSNTGLFHTCVKISTRCERDITFQVNSPNMIPKVTFIARQNIRPSVS